MSITKPERQTQNGVIALLLERLPMLKYVGNLAECENSNVREVTLMHWLTAAQGIGEVEAKKAVRQLRQTINQCERWENLCEVSEKVYSLLRYGTSVDCGAGKNKLRVHFIDWQHADKNVYELAEEVTVPCNACAASEHRRPDIVLYVNGIAFVVIELKRQGVPVAEAIRQNWRNQQTGYIPQFFTTVQLTLAGNPSEGLYYGTTCTSQKYYLRWKEPAGVSKDIENNYPMYADVRNELDRSLLQMLQPDRLLELIHDLIIYDGGVKKVCRPNQYFAMKAAQIRIAKRESGIIWHSQGAGKSLTMVWLAQWIKENIAGGRVVIITDREELDNQITGVLRRNGQFATKKPNGFYQAQSGSDLLTKLNNEDPWIITTLIHKYVPADPNARNREEYKKMGKKSVEQWMKEVSDNLERNFPNFKAKGNLFVFVDECHRTQGGILGKAMRKIMGADVILIGFTGTPLLQKKGNNRASSEESFGRYIHSYRFDEAVQDRVVLDLRYEARNVEQELTNPQALDALFNNATKPLTQKAREALQDRWAQLQNLYSSKKRMEKIVGDILFDMEMKDALREGYGNAMLVCDSIYECFQYWNLFRLNDFGAHCAVVTSYEPTDPGLGHGFTGEKKTEEELKYNYAKEMMGNRTPEQFEEWAKDQFINNPAQMKLLIVCDKLLTGFDAPSATYLYLDRKLIDHNLFQAICRVNRTNGERKEFGYIVDYKSLFTFIENAIEDYTNGENTEGFDNNEIKDLMKDRLKMAREALEKALKRVVQLSEPVQLPRSLDDYFDYFCFDQMHTPIDEQEQKIIQNAQRREDFYQAIMTLSRRYSTLAMEMEEAGYSVDEAKSIYKQVKDYDELRHALMQRSGDFVDMKLYDAEMRSLLDRYIEAPRSKQLASLDDFSFLDIIKIDDDGNASTTEDVEEELGGKQGVAETMTANTRRVINRKRTQNPAEYKKFSERLQRLLEEMRQGAISYEDFLKQVKAMGEELRNCEQGKDSRLDNAAKQDLWSNLGEDVELALKVYQTASTHAAPGFRQNERFQKVLHKELRKALAGTDYNEEVIYRIIYDHTEDFN